MKATPKVGHRPVPTPLPDLRDERDAELSPIARDLHVQRFLQPDDVTCGPTCLSKVYDFYGYEVEIDEVAHAIERNEDGGTLAVFLAMAALRRGFRARIYSYDLQIFDPTWAALPPDELVRKVRARFPYLDDAKRRRTAVAYVRFLEMGGELTFVDLTPALLKRIIDRGHPVLAGLSATYLYGMMRERTVDGRMIDDDVAGEPTGHFVVISGYDNWGRRLTILDPSEHVPASSDGRLTVGAERVINAILLGDVTYDAVLLELWPAHERETV
ncbi:MAG: cysteine peptidase family C39 domain-containing protein [Gemmatimonadota bacterium]